ncbi:MAG TPA: isoprenylcysteine carboxylmethyltransferase family protein [Longimicrobium sp.]|jgi:protein-S-isoprenylcysteine O-methyltransferase Ste14
MRKPLAAAISAVFFALAPGVVAGAVPWWLTGWRLGLPLGSWLPVRLVGALLLVTSVPVLVHAFARFVAQGRGTPAPVAPTERLVVTGAYRYVRNPMYLAVLAAIVGQAMLLWQGVLLTYAAVTCAFFVAFVKAYEEPTLARQFGEQYAAYRRAVPGWWPRRRPWAGPLDG